MENFASYLGKAICEHPFISAYVASELFAQISKTLRYGFYIHGFRRYGGDVKPFQENGTIANKVVEKIDEKAGEKLEEMKAAACDVAEDEDELEEESDVSEEHDCSVSDGHDKVAIFESGSSLLKSNYVLKD